MNRERELPGNHTDATCVGFISSCVDLGTSSITRSIESALKPSAQHYFQKGFRKQGLGDWFRFLRFLIVEARHCDVIVAAFNGPILATSLFSWICPKAKKCALLEWNELLDRSEQAIPFFSAYGKVYDYAFKRYDRLYTPSRRFADFYRTRGHNFQPFYIPLPPGSTKGRPIGLQAPLKVLFIGGDAKRKGGVELLEGWRRAAPENAELTFVCPSPPFEGVPGVSFLKSVRTGTAEHKALFSTHDILILPTYWDTYGFVILEAAAHGLCIVTTEAAGAADVAKMFGGIVSKDPASAVCEMLDLLEKPDIILERKRIAREGVGSYKELTQELFKALATAKGQF